MGESFTARSGGLEIDGLLDCISAPAILIDSDYRILSANGRYRQDYAAGGDVVGRRCFEVSHRNSRACSILGDRCPLETCARTGQPARSLHVHRGPNGEEHQEVTVYPVPREDDDEPAFLELVQRCRIASTEPDPVKLVGRSPAFNAMLQLVQRVAPTDTPVLLLGESGTGKELVAAAVHEQSARGGGPLVPVDCSGLNEGLFESELFGHERGSFTGAFARKHGLVETASGGTLFLDEIGDISPALQVKLLRLLETGMFRRVGGVDPMRTDFRLICATLRDLRSMVDRGEFRSDLYYRISAFPITIPPLRERDDDIELLAHSLLERIDGNRRWELAPETIALLRMYPFPGNIRELLHILERACILTENHRILPEHLPDECVPDRESGSLGPRFSRVAPLRELEVDYLRWAVRHFDGDNATLARRLGIGERTLYRKLSRLRKRDDRAPRDTRTVAANPAVRPS